MVSCNAITLPREFMATSWVQKEDEVRGAIPISLADEKECQDTGKIVFEKPTSSICQYFTNIYA